MDELRPFKVSLTLTVQVDARTQHGAGETARVLLQDILEQIDRMSASPSPLPAPAPAPPAVSRRARPKPVAEKPGPLATYPRPFVTWSHRGLAAE